MRTPGDPPGRPLTVAWISDFPVEWLEEMPASIRALPRSHPLTWQRVLAEELRQRPGIDLHVLVLRKGFRRTETLRRPGITFHLVKAPPRLRAPTLFWVDTWLLRPILARLRPDVVHAWGTEKGAMLVASRMAFPYLLTMQGLMSWLAETVPLYAYGRFAGWLERLSLQRAPWVTTESSFAVRFLERRFPGIRVRQVEHAPSWLFYRVDRRPASSPVRLVFNGLFCHHKGADLLLQMADRLARETAFELVVIGKKEPRAIKKLGPGLSPALWSRVFFREGLSPAGVAEELAQATLLIMPSRADNSPNAVKEAVVAGVPVVGSAVGGIPDYVVPEKNGMLFPAGDLAECIAATRAALAHPLLGRGQVDPATLAQVREYLLPRRMAESFLALYREIAGKPAQPCGDPRVP